MMAALGFGGAARLEASLGGIQDIALAKKLGKLSTATPKKIETRLQDGMDNVSRTFFRFPPLLSFKHLWVCFSLYERFDCTIKVSIYGHFPLPHLIAGG